MLIFPSDFHSQKLNNKLSIQPSSICQYSALIVLLVIENEAKNRLVDRSFSLEKMTVTMHGVRNVPLSKILTVQLGFQMTHYYRTHRSMHWDVEISLSHSSHNKALYSLSSLVSLQLFLWMNAPPFSFTLLFLRGERATVSTVSPPVSPRLSSLLVVPAVSSQQATVACSRVLGSEKSPSWRAETAVEQSVGPESRPLTSSPKLLCVSESPHQ